MGDKQHFLERKIQEIQRLSAKGYLCPLCNVEFHQEPKLWDHAKRMHSQALAIPDSGPENEVRKRFRTESMELAHKNSRRLHRGLQEAKSKPSSNDNDSMKPNVGEGVDTISSFRPLSAPGSVRDPQMHIDDIEHLTLDPTGIAANEYRRGEHTSTSVNPLKRGAVGDLEAREFPQEQALEQKAASNRRTKALSGGPFIGKDGDPDFKRESPRSPPEYNPSSYSPSPGKRLYDPNTDDPNSNPASRRAKQEPGTAARRFYDSRAHVFRSRKVNKKDDIQPKIIVNSNPRSRPPPVNVERPPQPVKLEESLWHTQNTSGLPISDKDLSPEPEILLQPETKPITHEQLVVEVKGIYAGLIMVEAKCMDVDAKQLNAAREENPSRRTKLSDEQWQTLIVLHKTLLHEHHDFFLASQHPSANLALSRLPAKYSMPTRMWRYGIQAFLEVLRHRLPESLEHMLAFIYIAYSMMALLYETVTLFEDIWIECLGDLGRYRMGIEDDIRDRDVWCGVARFWYIKAANKNPKTGRLYHHLGILARPHTLQQLSYYAKSLTCEIPFENARSSIMTHFNPILNGKETAFRSSVFETKFIKAHGILFTNGALDEFDTIVHDIVEGMLDNYIGRIAAKFKEQGVYVAETCIAAMFEYGLMDSSESPGSLFRLAYVETEKIQTEKLTQISHSTNGENSEDTESTTLVGSMNSSLIPSESITSSKHASSVDIVLHASKLAFGVLSVALQRVGDRNVFPLVHMFFVFLWSLSAVEKAMQYVQQDIPWDDICSFLTNTAVKSDSWNSKAWGEHFPKSELGPSRPLPEDHIMRDKIYAQRYFPETWFTDAAIDDEERALELPSMAAPRIERIQWLGLRIASLNKWISFHEQSLTFTVVSGVAERSISTNQEFQPLPFAKTTEGGDTVMHDANATDVSNVAEDIANSSEEPPVRSFQIGNLPTESKFSRNPNPEVLKSAGNGLETSSKIKNLLSEPVSKPSLGRMSPEIVNEDPYASDLHKLRLMHRFDDPENKEASQA